MIPLRDSAPRYSFPVFTLALILTNVLVFLYEVGLDPSSLEQFISQNAVIPMRAVAATQGRAPAEAAVLPLFTSMFLHGGWLHLIGNMWFLWIFGDNLEDNLGHWRYLFFYLTCGLAGALTHIFFNPLSQVPSVGASGAIAGVMGGYLLLFPGARVLTLVPFFLFFTIELPAYVMLLYWFAIQFFSGVASVSPSAQSGGGVAFWAHVGGFVTGLVLTIFFRRRRRARGYYQW